jgi:hypothetical protein
MSNIFGGKASSLNASKNRTSAKPTTPDLSVSCQISQADPHHDNRKIFQIEYDDPKSPVEPKLLGKRSFLKAGTRDLGDSDDGQLQMGGEAGDCLMSMRDVSYSSNDMDQLEIIEE